MESSGYWGSHLTGVPAIGGPTSAEFRLLGVPLKGSSGYWGSHLSGVPVIGGPT